MSHIHELCLTEGMQVEVRGQCVCRDGKPVITGFRMVPANATPPTLPWDQTPYVQLADIDERRSEFEPLLGATVYGRGVWTGKAVDITSLAADDSWTKPLSHEHEVKDTTPISPHIRTLEAPLFADGLMLRRLRLLDEFGPRVLVSATNVPAVRKVLEPIYGDALEIYESPWSASEIRALDDVLNDLPDERVLKIEYRMDANGVPSRKLRVDRVDEQLARTLSHYPSSMLFTEAVVEPEGTAQDRDVFKPIAPRTAERVHVTR